MRLEKLGLFFAESFTLQTFFNFNDSGNAHSIKTKAKSNIIETGISRFFCYFYGLRGRLNPFIEDHVPVWC